MTAAFFAVYVLITALSLPGAAIMTLAAGASFGLVWGTVVREVGTNNIAREITLGAGLTKTVPSHTLGMACISGAQANPAAHQRITQAVTESGQARVDDFYQRLQAMSH